MLQRKIYRPDCSQVGIVPALSGGMSSNHIRKGEEMKVANRIAQVLAAIENCENSGNVEWVQRWESYLDEIILTGPHGSGIDSGIVLTEENTTPELLSFNVPYHHMNENGYYCGWIDYIVVVKPSLQFGFDVVCNAELPDEHDDDVDICGTENYLADMMYEWLDSESPERAND